MRYRFVARLALLVLACLPAAAAAEPPVRLSAGFGDGARLGGQAPLFFGLQVDERRLPMPATEIRLLAPAGIDLGGLGLATCRLPSVTLLDVLFPSTPAVDCPRNAIFGRGTATAALLFDPEQRAIRGAANITLYSGEVQDDRPGLLVVARTTNPMTTHLAYAGRLSPAPRPFGLELALQIRAPLDPPFGADITLVRMRVTIGGSDLVYTRPVAGRKVFYRPGGVGTRPVAGRKVFYRPGGVGLPRRCPRGGLRFRAELRFADGTERAAETRVQCPRPLR